MSPNSLTARAPRRIAPVILILAILAALAPMAIRPGRARAATGSIASYINQPGDQVVTVPNGTYTGGQISAPHPATTGPYKGWLVLVAQSFHGVVVDMTSTPLVLDPTTSRVLFVGFKFQNGVVSVQGDDIAFWYTEHTFPIEEWNNQFQAAGGNMTALETMANGVPKTVWIGNSPVYRVVQRTQFLGADIHDVGDDGIYVDKSQSGVIDGTKIWNVNEKTYDPGYNPWNPNITDLIHNDGIQIPGAVWDLTVADSYVGQTITVGGDNASVKNLTWRNLWLSRADGVGMDFYSQNNYSLTGQMSDIRSWGEGYAQNPYDPWWDQLRVDIVNSVLVRWPTDLNSPLLAITSSGTNLNQSPPPGVTMTNGKMLDQSQALDNPLNPANVWRASHPYNTWPAYFGFPDPGTTTTAPPPSTTTSTTAAPAGTTSTTAAPASTTSTTAAPATTTTTVPAAGVSKVNAGGAALSTASGTWTGDTASAPSTNSNSVASGSIAYSTSAPIDMTDPSVPAGTPMSVLQTQRFGPTTSPEMQWSFPEANGDYEVRLYFAEIYAGTAKAGSRVFNVNVEGQALNNFDVYATAGAANKAIVKRFPVHLTDGTINVNFGHGPADNPEVQAIEIVPTTGSTTTTTAAPTSTSTSTPTTTPALTTTTAPSTTTSTAAPSTTSTTTALATTSTTARATTTTTAAPATTSTTARATTTTTAALATTSTTAPATVRAASVTPPPGYWLAAGDGSVYAFGSRAFLGSANTNSRSNPTVGISSTPTGKGYRLVGADGGVFSFGDAGFFGSTGSLKLNQPIVGMATTPSGKGYWLVASDGGIFAFGDAHFFGSTGGIKLNKPIVGIASTPTGNGYWLVASDGGIFAFGDARFYGSTGSIPLNQPIVGMAPTATGNGYWFVAADGGVFAFGDAKFFGSNGSKLTPPIVGIKASPSGNGYWLVAANGGATGFGDAPLFGSASGMRLNRPMVGMA